MFRTGSAVCAVVALLAAAPGWAQSGGPTSGTIEAGVFGQWTSFDENAGRENVVPEDGWGYGGRLGFFLTPRIQLEGDGYYSPQDRDLDESFCCTAERATAVDASAFALRLNYNLPLGSLVMGQASQFILGAGGVRTNYHFKGGTEAEGDSASFGVSGLAGLRIGLANRVALRLDGVVDHMPSHKPAANTNLHGRAGLSFLIGGARAVVAMAPPAPAPRPAPEAATPRAVPAPPAAPAERAMQICVVQNGQLQNVAASFRPATNDTVADGRLFSLAYPAGAPAYASGAAWFVQQDTMAFSNATWVKFGVSRVIQPQQLQRVGETSGTPLFAEVGRQAPYDVVYVPVRPGCEFQPYQPRAAIRPRG